MPCDSASALAIGLVLGVSLTLLTMYIAARAYQLGKEARDAQS